MYEPYTRQALPSEEYCALLGSAICVFNSNNAFIIENILRSNNASKDWYELIDLESGKLKPHIEKAICNENISTLFSDLVQMRNRIVHSYQITDKGQQVLATKTKVKDGNRQMVITLDYLQDFIEKNDELSSLLHEYRGY